MARLRDTQPAATCSSPVVSSATTMSNGGVDTDSGFSVTDHAPPAPAAVLRFCSVAPPDTSATRTASPAAA